MGLSSVNVKQLQSVPALSSPDEVSSARFTSKSDIDATQTDVCFVPIADIDLSFNVAAACSGL